MLLSKSKPCVKKYIFPDRQAPRNVAVDAIFATCAARVVNIALTATFRGVLSIWVTAVPNRTQYERNALCLRTEA